MCCVFAQQQSVVVDCSDLAKKVKSGVLSH